MIYQNLHQLQDIKYYNVIWYIRRHITCQSKNVIYFLKCPSCKYGTTHIDKTVNLRSLINNHITSFRLGGFTDKSDNHKFYFMETKIQEPFQRRTQNLK